MDVSVVYGVPTFSIFVDEALNEVFVQQFLQSPRNCAMAGLIIVSASLFLKLDPTKCAFLGAGKKVLHHRSAATRTIEFAAKLNQYPEPHAGKCVQFQKYVPSEPR